MRADAGDVQALAETLGQVRAHPLHAHIVVVPAIGTQPQMSDAPTQGSATGCGCALRTSSIMGAAAAPT